jgi:hypothetical protein
MPVTDHRSKKAISQTLTSCMRHIATASASASICFADIAIFLLYSSEVGYDWQKMGDELGVKRMTRQRIASYNQLS